MKRKRLYIIDGAGYYYRAYYGIRHQMNAPDGTPTNAIYGFGRMFGKILREGKPDALAIALDSPEKTFRHDMYPKYKEHRQLMPEDLAKQIPYIEKLIAAFRIPALKQVGLEADDLIGCAAVDAVKQGYDVTVVSGDKDLMQLVGPHIKMFDSMKDKWYATADVKEKFGVDPEYVVDVLALMGDASDNIPGVPGIGEKTAKALIAEYHGLENLLKHASDIKKPKLRESLLENAELARLCYRLATVKTGSDTAYDFESWHVTEPDRAALAELYGKLGFKSLLEEMGEGPPKRQVARDYKAILSLGDLKALVQRLKSCGNFAVDTETTSTEPMRAKLVGISVSFKEGEAYYIPLAHDYEGAPEQIAKADALEMLKPILEDMEIGKYGQNMKYDITVLSHEGIALRPASFDTMVASYVTAPEERRHGLSVIATKYLGMATIEYSQVAGKGAKEIPFNKVEIDKAAEYSAEDADATFSLVAVLKEELKMRGLEQLYNELELPLISVLAKMEQNGILLDIGRLKEYSVHLEKKMREIEAQVYVAAGEEFNIASPKQLSAILFDKLGLDKVRKTKTGSSTDQAVLETLAMGHPLPALVLRHRTLSKLKSTYIDPMPELLNPQTGRIHTSFNQVATATGRLSSSDPNLQNIPIRTEEGREIRRAFHAPKGYLLVSADYSQVELRVLAHLSGDRLLVESFKNDEDVHTRTAREIFGAMVGEPDSQMRRAAKAVNFGIIYGQTAFGLSQELGVGRREAQGYIDNYFARYSGVKAFIDATIKSAHNEKSVKTLFGRKRALPEIASANRNAREMAERMAVNTVVQGTAADLIKKAMLDIDRRIEGTGTKMLLQVHDELIFETPEKDLEKTTELIRRSMESAVVLNVPLKVSVEYGPNWGDMH